MKKLVWFTGKTLRSNLLRSSTNLRRITSFASYDSDQDIDSPTPTHQLPPMEPSSDADHITRILKSHYNPSHAMEAPLELHGLALSSFLVDQTLLRLKHSSKIALAFFHYSKNLPDQNLLSVDSYNILVETFGIVRQFDLVWQLIVEMDQNALAPTSSTFLILARRYIAAGMTEQALQAFDDMETFTGEKPTSKNFAFLIDTLCKYRFVKLAVRVFRERKTEFVMDVKIYTLLIYGWCKVGRNDLAERLFEEMIMVGIEPNVSTYNVFLDGICRRGKFHSDDGFGQTMREAEKLFDEMRLRGISPDSTSFSAVINICSRARKPELVLEKLRSMKASGIAPSVATYTSAVKCLCSCDRVEEAEDLVAEMAKEGISSSDETLNCFFVIYRERKDTSRALRLYRRMKNGQAGFCAPTVKTYNLMVGMFLGLGKMDVVREVWDDMRSGGVGPDLDTYTATVVKLCEMQKWSEACKLFVEMVESGYLPQESTVETLQKGLIRGDMVSTWRKLKKRIDLESITFGSEFKSYELKPYVR